MQFNVGSVDRSIRLVVGTVLIVLPFLGMVSWFETSWLRYASVLIGLVLVVTAALRFCPAYGLFGFRTSPRN